MNTPEKLRNLLDFYRSELLDNIIPWWMEHAIDWDNGGIYQFIENDGTVVSEDKYLWSQLRALYMWSALYNRVGKRHEWLQVARHVYEFIMRVGRDDQGQWVYWVDRDGNVKEGATSIYSDGFAIMGLTEYARATGDEQAAETALETYHNVQQRLARPGEYMTAPYVVPEDAKAHGISMIFSTVFHELGKLLNSAEVLDAGYAHAMQIMDHFRKPERRLLLEYVALDGSEIDGPAGRVVVPGHAIESMWFLIHIFRDRREQHLIEQAIECIRWHVEASWDPQFGGMCLAVDADGNDEVAWEHHEKKFWWPHTETMYALLLAYEHTREPWCLRWHERIHEWAYAHFPVRAHGEWHMRLDREGNVPKGVLSLLPLPIKDPFHLPRALVMCIDVLERLTATCD
jgi:N-acylglucosamine 2-epimerase